MFVCVLCVYHWVVYVSVCGHLQLGSVYMCVCKSVCEWCTCVFVFVYVSVSKVV